MYNFLQNVINELETNFTAKTNVAEWFSLHLKTHLSKNITLEDWNTLQVYIKNNVSDIQSLKNSLTDILNILNHEYVPTKGGVMFGNLEMKDNNIIFDEEEDSMKIGYDENGAKMSIDMQNSDYYKAHYHASGFRIGNGGIEANLDTEESRFEFSLGSHISTITPDGFSVRKEGETFYEDGRIGRYLDNSFTKHVEIKLPNKSGELALNEDIPTKTSQLINDSGFLTEHQDISGKADKTELKNYLPLNGAKKMTGGLDMNYYDITNTRLYDKERHNFIALSGLDDGDLTFSSTSGVLELRSPKMDVLDISNFLIYPTLENTNHIAGQEYETYEWNLPKESGTIALDKDIPTKTSQLTNNSGFITNAVNNLTNYYLKNETYTKYEVQQLFSTISSLKLEVVTNLPTTNISSNTIYLKPLDSAKENNIYEEYIYINSKWETIGTTAVALSEYAKLTDIDNIKNGNTIVKKAEQDSAGNVIKDTYLPISGGTMTGNINMGGRGITNVGKIVTEGINVNRLIAISSNNVDMTTPPTTDDIDTSYFSKGLEVKNVTKGTTNSLYFPQKSGTIALVEDVESLIESYLSTHYENGDEGSY